MLRALTLNLNSLGTRHGSWPERRRLVVAALRALKPDLIALQAVWRTLGGDSQADELAREVPGYDHVLFAPAMEEPGSGTKGIAVLARVPLVDFEWRPLSSLPGCEDAERRLLLVARFSVADGLSFSLYNAHFSWVPQQAAENLRETLPFVNGAEGAALLLGDFNFDPASPLHEGLKNNGWVDAWATLRGDEPGYTFEADRPSMRIDYAYANAALAPRLRAIDLVMADDDESARLSDHLGLLVTFDP